MSRAVPGSRPAVLVVEDEALIRLRAIDIVEEAGFDAIGVVNADDALRVLERRNDIRAVFTDVHMPGSMDGLALIRLMKVRWPSVAALITSGKVLIAAADLPSGARFLAKPYVAIQIAAALHQLIG
jgi:DNA-binding NtrC family response regulator